MAELKFELERIWREEPLRFALHRARWNTRGFGHHVGGLVYATKGTRVRAKPRRRSAARLSGVIRLAKLRRATELVGNVVHSAGQ